MNSKSSPIKFYLMMLTLALSIIYAIPNLYGEDPAIEVSSNNQEAISLDIKNKIEQELTKAKIPHSISTNDDDILIRFKDTDEQITAKDILKDKVSSENLTYSLNLSPRTPAWLTAIGAYPMKLGLDLRGGVHFLLDVDTNSLMKARATGDIKTITQELRDQKIRYKKISLRDQRNIVIVLKNSNDSKEATAIARKSLSGYNIHPSKDIPNTIIATLSTQNIQTMNY